MEHVLKKKNRPTGFALGKHFKEENPEITVTNVAVIRARELSRRRMQTIWLEKCYGIILLIQATYKRPILNIDYFSFADAAVPWAKQQCNSITERKEPWCRFSWLQQETFSEGKSQN